MENSTCSSSNETGGMVEVRDENFGHGPRFGTLEIGVW